MGYSLNADTAKKADKTGGAIRDPGLYAGKIKHAYEITSSKGTTGISIAFATADGYRADQLELWTHKQDGEELSALNVVNSIMAVLRLRTMDPKPGRVELWSGGQLGTETRNVFAELAGKPIGFGINMEQYRKSDGSVGAKPVLAFAFDPATKLVASEILEKKMSSTGKLDQMAARLWVRPLKDGGGQRPAGGQRGQPVVAGEDLADDDIPF